TALVGAGYHAKMEVNLAYRQLRADILMQNSISFEIQCSPISDIEFDHRHNLYEKIGIKDVWVVGRRHFLHQQLRESQKKFLRFNQQWGWYYLEINPYEADISLKYNILLSPISRKLKYQIKKFSLDDLGIRKFFNFVPYLKRYSLPDVQFQRQYLHKKIQQKTGYGLQVAQLLYENRKSVEDIPVEILTQYYLPKQSCPLVQYLQKIAEDKKTK
ncbi:MAG: competence protein CoiA family protein, partial [Lactobacillus iners]|nr:competence protein CoiA family protein [Lactobacillus iners]